MKKRHLKYYFIGTLILILLSFIICSNSSPKPPVTNLDLTLTNNDFYLDEMQYDSQMSEIVIPYLDNHRTTGYFSSFDNTSIYYEEYLKKDATAHIVLLHGFTENSQKYKELIYYFLKYNYNVSLLDHRGHGYSERLTSDSSKVHIDAFQNYVDDLRYFIEQVVTKDDNIPYYLFAHSMGGAIGTRYLEQYPDTFKAAILSSPMMSIETGGCPRSLAKGITKLALLTSLNESYIFGQGPFQETPDMENSAATSQARYTYQFNNQLQDLRLQQSGGSFNWLAEAFKAVTLLQKETSTISCPVLVFQAEHDTFVSPKGHYQFINAVPNSKLIFVKDAKHELYNTKNELMIPYFNTIFQFLAMQP